MTFRQKSTEEMEHLVKFETKVKQGMIDIPEEYKHQLEEGSKVMVIINPVDDESKTTRLMDKLAKNPISVKGQKKLTREEIHER
ncbi:hypothetical protein cce_0865 [Crocosphaera subtropica ATCC 51142]|uniref:Uncharacterized protein n=1 Tax=Crocosphaera subtropica (strain ATCC 51142 / BH68) TaxID=43989 RepID=B1WS22_CROS5|nr:hypothetical protein [Crocosphaera subtropica]ACB50216.1 hypothetical protein cce_0865 [Crocosphaera subtropica ATCC 51142]